MKKLIGTNKIDTAIFISGKGTNLKKRRKIKEEKERKVQHNKETIKSAERKRERK